MVTVCPHCGKRIDNPNQIYHFTDEEVARFWRTITQKESGCWISNSSPSGIYGRIFIGGRRRLSHVVSWLIHNGPIPDDKKVCHTCDNPRCVRPDHLFLDTNSGNMLDMVRKKRHKPLLGEKNPLSKFSADDVLFIRNSIVNGEWTISGLAKRFATSFQSVYQVARGNVWQHVGGPLIEKRVVRKLSADEVMAIRRLRAEGMKQDDIAAKFGLYQGTVSAIIRGVKRKDVPLNAT